MATQETLQNLQYPKFVSDRQQQMLNTLFGTQAGGGLLGQQQKIPGQQVAGFTPTQTGAMNLASQGIGAYQPYLDAAQAAQTAALGTAGAGTQALSSMQFDPSQVQQYMNPYQQNVTQDALKEMDRQGAMAQNQLAGQAVGAVFLKICHETINKLLAQCKQLIHKEHNKHKALPISVM